ncbi:EXS family-domain-containing protein [Halenospora varia]|nr:EXS family-domain-containing protein [Halenospora varia]
MKFGKELESELVPEWKVKYLDYKAGKRHIKAIADAIHKSNVVPLSPPTPSFSPPPSPLSRRLHRRRNDGRLQNYLSDEAEDAEQQPKQANSGRPTPRLDAHGEQHGRPTEVHHRGFTSTLPVAAEDADFERPDSPTATRSNRNAHPNAPLISRPNPPRNTSGLKLNVMGLGVNRNAPAPGEVGTAGGPTEAPWGKGAAGIIRRRTVAGLISAVRRQTIDISLVPLNPVNPVDRQKNEFFRFILTEFNNVERFYKSKEEQAGTRLRLLREQLHEMRNRRADEIMEAQRKQNEDVGPGREAKWVDRIKRKISSKFAAPGPDSRSLPKMPQTPIYTALPDARRDFVPKPDAVNVPYPEAKRQLKLAFQEYYRGLDLLKSYAVLNRTAFRKLNKKYDKAVRPSRPLEFVQDYVDKAWFVNSDVIEGHVKTTEDLYARYFERGNSKAAVSKLRSHKGYKDESKSAFLNGLLIGTGFIFAIDGLISGVRLLSSDDKDMRKMTSSHLKLYAGYFLMLCIFFLFCLDCQAWTKNKVNYPFIFEFDSTHHLDWRKLAKFPSFFTFLFGITFWLNFTRVFGGRDLFLWYPVILILISLAIIILPLPVLYHRSRKWFAYAHWRLLLAGFYPVEFRDVFLGDIYCSLTYSVSNIELFFCLCVNGWEEPQWCGSSQSRVRAFLSALPPMWRAQQCLRRYYDSPSAFPHLVNAGKYASVIMVIVTLSMYHNNLTNDNLGLFIFCALVNSVFASFWDLYMDFGLLQRHSKNFLLRDILTFEPGWIYYVIIVVDPILRLSWIPYTIFTNNMQPSGLVAFIIGFVEVFRRGAWALFRLENEHCANITQHRASRDVPLPYKIHSISSAVGGDGASSRGSPELALGVEATTPFIEEGLRVRADMRVHR